MAESNNHNSNSNNQNLQYHHHPQSSKYTPSDLSPQHSSSYNNFTSNHHLNAHYQQQQQQQQYPIKLPHQQLHSSSSNSPIHSHTSSSSNMHKAYAQITREQQQLPHSSTTTSHHSSISAALPQMKSTSSDITSKSNCAQNIDTKKSMQISYSYSNPNTQANSRTSSESEIQLRKFFNNNNNLQQQQPHQPHCTYEQSISTQLPTYFQQQHLLQHSASSQPHNYHHLPSHSSEAIIHQSNFTSTQPVNVVPQYQQVVPLQAAKASTPTSPISTTNTTATPATYQKITSTNSMLTPTSTIAEDKSMLSQYHTNSNNNTCYSKHHISSDLLCYEGAALTQQQLQQQQVPTHRKQASSVSAAAAIPTGTGYQSTCAPQQQQQQQHQVQAPMHGHCLSSGQISCNELQLSQQMFHNFSSIAQNSNSNQHLFGSSSIGSAIQNICLEADDNDDDNRGEVNDFDPNHSISAITTTSAAILSQFPDHFTNNLNCPQHPLKKVKYQMSNNDRIKFCSSCAVEFAQKGFAISEITKQQQKEVDEFLSELCEVKSMSGDLLANLETTIQRVKSRCLQQSQVVHDVFVSVEKILYDAKTVALSAINDRMWQSINVLEQRKNELRIEDKRTARNETDIRSNAEKIVAEMEVAEVIEILNSYRQHLSLTREKVAEIYADTHLQLLQYHPQQLQNELDHIKKSFESDIFKPIPCSMFVIGAQRNISQEQQEHAIQLLNHNNNNNNNNRSISTDSPLKQPINQQQQQQLSRLMTNAADENRSAQKKKHSHYSLAVQSVSTTSPNTKAATSSSIPTTTETTPKQQQQQQQQQQSYQQQLNQIEINYLTQQQINQNHHNSQSPNSLSNQIITNFQQQLQLVQQQYQSPQSQQQQQPTQIQRNDQLEMIEISMSEKQQTQESDEISSIQGMMMFENANVINNYPSNLLTGEMSKISNKNNISQHKIINYSDIHEEGKKSTSSYKQNALKPSSVQSPADFTGKQAQQQHIVASVLSEKKVVPYQQFMSPAPAATSGGNRVIPSATTTTTVKEGLASLQSQNQSSQQYSQLNTQQQAYFGSVGMKQKQQPQLTAQTEPTHLQSNKSKAVKPGNSQRNLMMNEDFTSSQKFKSNNGIHQSSVSATNLHQMMMNMNRNGISSCGQQQPSQQQSTSTLTQKISSNMIQKSALDVEKNVRMPSVVANTNQAGNKQHQYSYPFNFPVASKNFNK